MGNQEAEFIKVAGIIRRKILDYNIDPVMILKRFDKGEGRVFWKEFLEQMGKV